MKQRPRLYTDWRRPSRSRRHRLALLIFAAALAALSIWMWGALPPAPEWAWP